MILEVMIWGCLFATVQSAVTSAETCVYMSQDGSCSGGIVGECTDMCAEAGANCDQLSCDLMQVALEALGMPGWGTCYTSTYDLRSTCEDDGDDPTGCDGDNDLCQTTCTSTNGRCENCFDLPIDMDEYNLGGLDCDEYESVFPSFYPDLEFPGFCKCFTMNGAMDIMIGCPSACGSGSSGSGSGSSDSGSGSSDNTGMIIGIVAGVVVLIVVVIAVIICMKGRKKL